VCDRERERRERDFYKRPVKFSVFGWAEFLGIGGKLGTDGPGSGLGIGGKLGTNGYQVSTQL